MTTVTESSHRVAVGRRSTVTLVGAAIALGVAAHFLGGGGTSVDCLPLLGAAALALVTTLAAQRLRGSTYRATPAVAALFGIGQLGMHLALNQSLNNHVASFAGQPEPDRMALFGLTCGLIVAHTAATGLLVILFLGARQSMELTAHVMLCARRRLRALEVPALCRAEAQFLSFRPRTEPAAVASGEQLWRYGPVKPRRGPPARLAH